MLRIIDIKQISMIYRGDLPQTQGNQNGLVAVTSIRNQCCTYVSDIPISRDTKSQHGVVFRPWVSGSGKRFRKALSETAPLNATFRKSDGWFGKPCLIDYHLSCRRLIKQIILMWKKLLNSSFKIVSHY